MTPAESEWSFPNAATAPGTGSYYAVRFSPAATRELHARQLAWYALIGDIARQPGDPGVARLKLDWWHEEIDRGLHRQAPRHPLMTGLITEGMGTAAGPPMHAVIDAAERRIRQPSLDDGTAFWEACRATGGNLFQALCAAPTGATYDTERAAALGAYWEAVTRLCRSPQDPAIVPRAYLTALSGDAGHRLPGAAADSFYRYPDKGTALRDEPVPELARRLTAVARGLARRLDQRVGERPVERAPIAHLWTAWRCR